MLRLFILPIVLLCGYVYASELPSQTPLKSTTKSKSTTIQSIDVTQKFPVVELSPSSILKIEASSKKDERHGYFSSEWWLVYITGFLSLITGGLATYTWKLWGATDKLVNGSEKIAEKQLRAYVHGSIDRCIWNFSEKKASILLLT